MSAEVPTFAISDESTDSVSNNEASGSASESIQNPKRNIAVKKGTPIGAQQPKSKPSIKCLNLLKDSEFLNNFNPENSRREKNKRHIFSRSKPTIKRNNSSMYDEQGRIRVTMEDVCDCFEPDCDGCHFPCQSCGSSKCGIKCRVNRKWAYEVIEHDGKDQVKTNSLITTITTSIHHYK